MASLDNRAPAGSHPQSIFRPLYAATLILLGFGLFAFHFFHSQPVSTPRPDQPSSTDSPSIRQLAGSLPDSVNRHLMEFGKTVNQPLEIEMKSVVIDAKAAIQLLAGNFLPEQETP